MSRIGTQPVALPNGVSATISDDEITIKGSKGELTSAIPTGITIKQEDNALVAEPVNENRETKAFHGTVRSVVQNLVTGVSEGFEITLELRGVGYRGAVQGKELVMNLGYSHDVHHAIPDGVDIKVNKNTEIVITGIDKQLIGQTADNIRKWRKPEPYKGKGIFYTNKYGKGGEYVRRKEGKKK